MSTTGKMSFAGRRRDLRRRTVVTVRRIPRWVWVAALLIAVGAAGFVAGRGGAKTADKAAPAPPPASAGPPTVTLNPQQLSYAQLALGSAQAATLPTRLATLGTITPNINAQSQVLSRVSGKIVRIPVNVGQSVSEGQILAVVASPDLAQAQAAYHDALLRRAAARATLARVTQLGQLGEFGRPALQGARVSAAQARGEVQANRDGVVSAQAQVAQAQAQVNLTGKQYVRAGLLYQAQLLSRQDLEQSEASKQQAIAALGAAQTAQKAAADRLTNAQTRAGIFDRDLVRQTAIAHGGYLTAAQVGPARSAALMAGHEVEAAAAAIRLLGGPLVDESSPQGGLLSIRAPIAGRVSARMVSAGEAVMPDKPLLTVTNLTTVIAQLSVYQEDLAHLRVGQRVVIEANTAPGVTFSGTVSAIGTALDPATRAVPVYCAIQNTRGALRPGVYVRGTIYGASRRSVLTVPQDAVQGLDAGPSVFTPGKKPGVYVAVPVKTGETVDGTTEITQGLGAGQAVVTKNAFLLKSQLGK